jgi:L-2,4-diaminobutyrate transaminase
MQLWDIHPDLVSFAKGLSSGYLPLSASVVSDHVYETIRDEMPDGLPMMFGLTYNNHPTCCAAALANLDIIEREGLVENARVVGAYLLDRLGRPSVARRSSARSAARDCWRRSR